MRRFRSIFVFIMIALLFTACASEDIPEGIMAQDQMVPVLTDLEIAYAGVDQVVKDPHERLKKYEEMNRLVLKKHNVEHEAFYASYQWYESKPVILDSIFKQVVTQLNQELASIQGKGEPAIISQMPDSK